MSGQIKNGTGYIFNFDALYNCEAWHIYGFEWTEEKAVWTVDGKLKESLIELIRALKELENGQMKICTLL